jgi:3-hydroxybutyrate dehydrogenase
MTDASLGGRSALVTGSTSGTGLGIATALAKAGCDLTLNDFGDPAAIERTRAGLAATCGVKVRCDGADMSQGEQVVQMVHAAEAAFGALGILVNNAGLRLVAPIEEFPAARWPAILAIDLSSNCSAIHAALPGMRQRGYGRIVNIASAHGPGRLVLQGGLGRRQARRGRSDQGRSPAQHSRSTGWTARQQRASRGRRGSRARTNACTFA